MKVLERSFYLRIFTTESEEKLSSICAENTSNELTQCNP